MLIFNPNNSIFTNNTFININVNNGNSFNYSPAFKINAVHIRVFKDKISNVIYELSDIHDKSYIYSQKQLKNISISQPNYNFYIKPFKNKFELYDIDYIDINISNNNTSIQMIKDNKVILP